jgi:hypothetical protein
MIIRPVELNYVNQTWPLVRGYIDESINKGLVGGTSDYTADQVLVYLTTGQWILIVAVDEDNKIHGAMTVSFINYPMNRVAFVTATGGKMIINQETFDQLKRIAKYHGATKIQAMARPAMVRLLQTCNMVPGNTLMEAMI